jgi:SAM-dependent methyltransferase
MFAGRRPVPWALHGGLFKEGKRDHSGSMQLFSPVCPRCRSGLQRNGESLGCLQCGAVFPVHSSIVDFLHPFPLPAEQAVIARRFDQVAAEYDSTVVSLVEEAGCPWNLYADQLEKVVRQAAGKIILDVGCGTSFPAGPFVPDDSIYLGLDISMGMLNDASSLFRDKVNFSFWHIDVERIPLPADSVDLCLALLVLNAVSDPAGVARQIRRVLRADGELFGSVLLDVPALSLPLFPFAPARAPSLGQPAGDRPLEEFFSVLLSDGRTLRTLRKARFGDILLFHLQPETPPFP